MRTNLIYIVCLATLIITLTCAVCDQAFGGAPFAPDATRNPFSRSLLQIGTALGAAGMQDYAFELGDWDGDGKLDLFAIKKFNTGTRSTEIHILSGESQFRNYLLQTGTVLGEVGMQDHAFELGDWDGNGKLDLFAIKKFNTVDGRTNVQIISGGQGPGSPDSPLSMNLPEALDQNRNGKLDDEEILLAIQLWISGEVVQPTDQFISDDTIKTLIQMWLLETDIPTTEIEAHSLLTKQDRRNLASA